MPTYTVQTGEGHLGPATMAALAEAITRTHATVTGAPAWFAQVVFHEVPAGHRFLAGRPLRDDLVFVSGTIRGGSRGAELKSRLATQLTAAVTRAAGCAAPAVWVYLVDLPPGQMVEFGRPLPDAGGEAQWLEEFPADQRELLRSMEDEHG